ncbi:pilus assembly PilX family protein [[Pseudomonas] boreopolis]|uniref:pilus assembly PilX family protein n=1 Tax=Xanthomonas boreopolis TaxID=86183 RepID=UPI003D3E5AA4
MDRQISRSHGPKAERQSGAVLYVALIILILLALLGVVGMQVTGLQEKMASNYRAANLAFQNAEAQARNVECGVEDLVNRTSTVGCPAVSNVKVCDEPFDAVGWAASLTYSDGDQTNVRLIGPCISGNSSFAMGKPINEDANPIYQITAYSTNDGANGSADSAVDTIFRP